MDIFKCVYAILAYLSTMAPFTVYRWCGVSKQDSKKDSTAKKD